SMGGALSRADAARFRAIESDRVVEGVGTSVSEAAPPNPESLVAPSLRGLDPHVWPGKTTEDLLEMSGPHSGIGGPRLCHLLLRQVDGGARLRDRARAGCRRQVAVELQRVPDPAEARELQPRRGDAEAVRDACLREIATDGRTGIPRPGISRTGNE